MKLRRQLSTGGISPLRVCVPAMAANAVHPVHGTQAMVATLRPEASQAGVEVMQKGGNAVDAAVAVGFRAGRGSSRSRQPRRRRIHALPPARWRSPLPRLPREGASQSDGQHVPRQPGQCCARSELDRLQGHRRSRLGGGAGLRAAALGQAFAEAGHGARNPPGARRLHHQLRRSQVAARSWPGEVSRIAPHLPARW